MSIEGRGDASRAHQRFAFRELSAHAIRRARLLIVACAGLLALAGFAWSKLPRAETPRVEPTEAIVVLELPGASPEDVEADVLPRVEEVLYATKGVQWVESTAVTNGAYFHVKLEAGTEMDAGFERLRGRVASVKKDLPAGVKDAEVRRLSTDLTPALLVAVVGTRSDDVLTHAGRRLKTRLEAVPGVRGIDLWGEVDPAVRIRIDTARLPPHRLSATDVVERVRAANVRAPAGQLPVGKLDALIAVNQRFTDAESVARTPLATSVDRAGVVKTVTLGDVAAVTDGHRTRKRRFFYNGDPAVALEIRFNANEDALRVAERVHAEVAAAGVDAAPGTRVVVAHDRQQWTARALNTFWDSLGEGTLLVIAIVAVGLGLRASLVVAAILPLSLAGAFIGLYACGFAIEQLTLAGLIVSLGLLVDDAIVVTESIALLRAKGLGRFRAAVLGTARVFWANNVTTAVACASFIPLFFMTGTIGEFVRGLPTAVVFSLVTSLLVAQLLTPWIATLLLRRPPGVTPIADDAPFDRREDLSEAHGGMLVRPFQRLYARIAPFIVRRPGVVIALACVGLAASVGLLPRIGFQFFPKADRPSLFVTVQMPPGQALADTEEKVREVMRAVREDPEVVDVSAVAGQGYPDIFYGGRLAHRPSSDVGDVLVRTRSKTDTSSVAARLRVKVRRIAGANVHVEELWTGPYVPHPINIRLRGADYAELRRSADAIERELRAVPGAIHVSDNMADEIPLAVVTIDPALAARASTSGVRMAQSLRSLYGEDKIAEFRRGDDQVEIVVDAQSTGDGALADLENTTLRNDRGRAVPVLGGAHVELTYGVSELKHRDGQRIVQVFADVEGATLPAHVIERVRPFLERLSAERGFAFTCAGAAEETRESFHKLGAATVVALILIFVLLMLVFDSFTLSFAVLAAVPFGLAGALVGLFVTGNPFGFMAFLGLIALLAVYVNHKIYFVDRYRELIERGYSVDGAIIQAGLDRVRPVVLTAFTAVLGLLPLAIGGGPLWTAFGWVNVFGLLASIPLSLVLLPALIVALAPIRAWAVARGVRRRRPERVSPRDVHGAHVVPDRAEAAP